MAPIAILDTRPGKIDRHLTTEEASRFLLEAFNITVAPQTFRDWETRNRPGRPLSVKAGGRRYYTERALREWVKNAPTNR